MNKKIKALLLTVVLSISMVGCSNIEKTNETNQEPIQDKQIEVDNQDTLYNARDYVEEMIELAIVESDASVEYNVKVDNGYILVTFNYTQDEFKHSIEHNRESWNRLVEQYANASKNISDSVSSKVGEPISVAIMIGDMDKDDYYAGIKDGYIVYNVMNEYNN
nr:MAG TPA: putative peptidyl-prolyl cis-trans isomerase [Caudoviricetes sp.]